LVVKKGWKARSAWPFGKPTPESTMRVIPAEVDTLECPSNAPGLECFLGQRGVPRDTQTLNHPVLEHGQ
jgi:hypothetical protein